MTRVKKQNTKFKPSTSTYSKFKQINGKHPLRDATEECFIDYKARARNGGKVAAFNFDLAKEIGLIPKSHPNVLNKDLEKMIVDTFGIIIINEYDQINNIKFPEKEIRKNSFMATRYLQLQHPNKQGKTSGDGRSIWNGYVTHEGKTYDISSCGTGATSLSPATHIKNRFFQSGDPTISYGCGYSEIDEGMATLFFSEIMNRNNIQTERVLGIIDFGKNIGITIRVHENLLRPSHLFNHLKQNNVEALENLVEYYTARQENNSAWTDVPKTKGKRLEYFLQQQADTFAKMAARFEDDYIFCWLDWDGDNILMDGGIIDYGSIRQFGLFHSEYRYDDVERYSTSIVEQKQKARYIVQTFAQIIDYLKSGKKKGIKDFAEGSATIEFDKKFQYYKNRNLALKLGFNPKQVDFLLKKKSKKLEEFRKVFYYFESAKSVKGLHEVADGINWNAIYCMRDILRELPQLYLARGKSIENSEFIEIIKSTYAVPEDLVMTSYKNKKITEFQKIFWELVSIAAEVSEMTVERCLLVISMRASIINKYDRVTGDSITTIVDKILAHKPKFKPHELYSLLHEFTEYQNLDPDNKKHVDSSVVENSKFIKNIFQIVREYREGL